MEFLHQCDTFTTFSTRRFRYKSKLGVIFHVLFELVVFLGKLETAWTEFNGFGEGFPHAVHNRAEDLFASQKFEPWITVEVRDGLPLEKHLYIFGTHC